MLWRSILLLAMPMALSAQEDPSLPEPAQTSTVTQVAVGGYDQSFSNGWGRWQAIARCSTARWPSNRRSAVCW